MFSYCPSHSMGWPIEKQRQTKRKYGTNGTRTVDVWSRTPKCYNYCPPNLPVRLFWSFRSNQTVTKFNRTKEIILNLVINSRGSTLLKTLRSLFTTLHNLIKFACITTLTLSLYMIGHRSMLIEALQTVLLSLSSKLLRLDCYSLAEKLNIMKYWFSYFLGIRLK